MQSIGSAVVDVTPGDYFELIARQNLQRRQERRGRGLPEESRPFSRAIASASMLSEILGL
jgi:hypothetical protein